MKAHHNTPKPRHWYYTADWKGVRPYSPKLRAWFKATVKPYLEALEEGYQHGEKDALMAALALCAQCGLEPPLWVRLPIVLSYFQTRPKSWDDVFGRPTPKGKSVRKFNRRRRDLMIVERVRELAAQDVAVDDGLFSAVGEEFGVSGGTVKGVYYNKDIAHYFSVDARARKSYAAMRNEVGPGDDAMANWLEHMPERPSKQDSASLRKFSKNFP